MSHNSWSWHGMFDHAALTHIEPTISLFISERVFNIYGRNDTVNSRRLTGDISM